MKTIKNILNKTFTVILRIVLGGVAFGLGMLTMDFLGF